MTCGSQSVCLYCLVEMCDDSVYCLVEYLSVCLSVLSGRDV